MIIITVKFENYSTHDYCPPHRPHQARMNTKYGQQIIPQQATPRCRELAASEDVHLSVQEFGQKTAAVV